MGTRYRVHIFIDTDILARVTILCSGDFWRRIYEGRIDEIICFDDVIVVVMFRKHDLSDPTCTVDFEGLEGMDVGTGILSTN